VRADKPWIGLSSARHVDSWKSSAYGSAETRQWRTISQLYWRPLVAHHAGRGLDPVRYLLPPTGQARVGIALIGLGLVVCLVPEWLGGLFAARIGVGNFLIVSGVSFLARAFDGSLSTPTEQPPEPLMPTSTENTVIKSLFLAANPARTYLALDEEVRAIDAKIRGAEHRDRLSLLPHLAVRLDDLSGILLRHKPHVVHFSGHGTPSG